MVEYRTIPDIPGQYFSCSHYGLMSVAACSRNFAEAPGATKAGRLEACIGCRVGHGHAHGQANDQPPVPPPKAQGSFAYRVICVRCRRGGMEDDGRLIGRMRLVRNRTICVSCYNREREVLLGRNAKGAPPKKWSQLFWRPVSYVQQTQCRLEQLPSPIRDWKEAALTILRRSADPVAFVWTGSRAVGGGMP